MTEVTLQDAPQGDTQAHIDAMVAKADGKSTPVATPETDPAATPAERPSWLPAGFDTPEALAEAYAATQAQKVEDPATATEADTAAAEAVASAGLDMAALESKLIADGALADEDYTALAKVGITKEMANTYIDGQRAMGEALVARIHTAVGGEEQFNSILSWASENLPAAEVAAFNRVVDTADEGTVTLALEGLAAKYSKAGQQAPKLMTGQRTATGANPFRSTAEMTAAMRDSRYATDTAYRDDVISRLAASSIM